ncbi:MAG TPA: hypothetical protein VN040_14210 [Pseudosphingobacterium sp.]|nr:hypothetical protein [Pseudosphingobacterium sp.]
MERIGRRERILKDERVTVHHIALFAAIVFLTGDKKAIHTSRRELLALSHISNLMTYHKCMKQLVTLGYISYLPSYHPKNGSRIGILD